MVYVYAITDSGAEVSVSGMKGAEVRVIPVGDVDVLVSEHEQMEPSADVNDLWAHEGVVENAGKSGVAVLPLRLGSLVPDEAAAVTLVEERAEEFTTSLNRVRGAVEIGVRAAVAPEGKPAEEAHAEGGPGTAYLMKRLAQKQRGDEVIDLVHKPLADLARDHVRLDRTIADGPSVRLAYLVDEEAVEPFQELVRDLESELGHVRLACTGPWPPYSFAGGGIE